MATIYRPRFCYQKANCNQPPKSELLLNANRYQPRKFIKRELVSFCFFIVFGNDLLYEKNAEVRVTSYHPKTTPKRV